MSTLQDRLEKAMDHAKKKQADLARACGISTAAVAKWFGGNAKNLKMEHLFSVADECQVSARWLGTGKGPMSAGDKPDPNQGASAGIPKRRIELIQMYGRLPDEVRLSIRQLIETLAWMQHPRKDEYLKRQRRAHAMVHEE